MHVTSVMRGMDEGKWLHMHTPGEKSESSFPLHEEEEREGNLFIKRISRSSGKAFAKLRCPHPSFQKA
jgi:hypothetical protein